MVDSCERIGYRAVVCELADYVSPRLKIPGVVSMKIAQILSALVLAAILVGDRPALAKPWSLETLNPFGKKESKQPPNRTASKASPLGKLNVGTRRFFAKTKGFFTLDRHSTKSSLQPPSPWVRSRGVQQQAQQPQKTSWLDSLLHPPKPKVPESLDDWMSLKRQDI